MFLTHVRDISICGFVIRYSDFSEYLITLSGDDLLSRAVAHQVSSALQSLTSVFGMGTGGTSASLSPDFLEDLHLQN